MVRAWIRHPIARINGLFGPSRTRWVSAASIATQREYQRERAGEQERAVREEHEIAISAERCQSRRQQQREESERDQQPHPDAAIDDHTGESIAPITAKANQEPGAHALPGHAGQDL